MNNYKYSIPKDIICKTLLELAEKDERIVVLSSDVSVSTSIEEFKQKYPNRFFELGIAEQSTMSVAGGLAAEGFIPVYVALAIFSCGMTWAQMRQICNADFNVKIIGTHSGVDDGQDGAGHHATEDIAITRVLPRMTVLTPSDEVEVADAIRKMVGIDGPVYMRIARADTPIIHSDDYSFSIGKADIVYDTGDDFAILYEGSALTQSLEAWEMLSEKGIKGKLVSIGTMKPMDKETIISLNKKVKVIVTAENHSVIGGLYTSVAEVLVSEPHTAKLIGVGFEDRFLESGSADDLKIKYGLSGKRICEEVINSL